MKNYALEFQKSVLRNVVVGHGLLELVDLLQLELPDFGDGFYFQFLHHVADIETGPGLAEALLLQERDLLLQVEQLVQEILLHHRGLQDRAAENGRDNTRMFRIEMDSYVIMASGITMSVTNCESSPLTAWRFFSLRFIWTDCCWSDRISVLMLPKSDWKVRSIASIR